MRRLLSHEFRFLKFIKFASLLGVLDGRDVHDIVAADEQLRICLGHVGAFGPVRCLDKNQVHHTVHTFELAINRVAAVEFDSALVLTKLLHKPVHFVFYSKSTQ